jgi:hypothetical protein
MTHDGLEGGSVACVSTNCLFAMDARHRAVDLTHSGERNSLPEDFVPFANRYPEVTLIPAHLGGLEPFSRRFTQLVQPHSDCPTMYSPTPLFRRIALGF